MNFPKLGYPRSNTVIGNGLNDNFNCNDKFGLKSLFITSKETEQLHVQKIEEITDYIPNAHTVI